MPNRIIKDSICDSKKLSSLSDFEFRLWIHLVVFVDDYGRGQADPQLIKGHCFPRMDKVTLKQIDAALVTLARKGCITLYDVDGDSYFYFPTWADHQRIQTKRSKYPGVEDGEIRNPTVGHGESPSESNTIQSNKNPNTNTTRTSANVQRHKYGQYNNVLLSDDDLLKLQNEFPVDWKERIEQLSEYMESKGAKYSNHLATIRSWARKDAKQNTNKGNTPEIPKDDSTFDAIFGS